MWRSRQLLQRRSDDGHAFSGGYVWLESSAKPVSRVSRKAVIAAATNYERGFLHVAQHAFIVKRQMSTLSVASCESDSDFGHVTFALARCRTLFWQRVLAKSSACVDRIRSKASGTLVRNSYYISTADYCTVGNRATLFVSASVLHENHCGGEFDRLLSILIASKGAVAIRIVFRTSNEKQDRRSCSRGSRSFEFIPPACPQAGGRSRNTGAMTHVTNLRTCTCMRRIAADKGSTSSLGNSTRWLRIESSCLVPV